MFKCICAGLLLAGALSGQYNDLGYTDTPFYPGSKWHVHDSGRPRPPVVTPGDCNGPSRKPPSNADILFDGRDTSKWDTKWNVANGYMEVTPGQGGAVTKEAFGDMQLHLEWATPAEVKGNSQGRGNSGILLMGKYEVQVLDSYNNPTYADGQAAAIYGQTPPLFNASCKPGEWQTYDIVFESPKFSGEKLSRPAYVTVIHNGIVVQNHTEILGTTPHRQVGTYTAHGDLPLELQNHNNPVRYRNIWMIPLKPRP